MSQFDAAIGMNAATLNSGLNGLYSDPAAKQKFFEGTHPGQVLGVNYTASWAAQGAPTFTLAPPSAQTWSASIGSGGTSPTTPVPTANVFQLVFPAFNVQYTLGTAPTLSASPQVIAVGQLTVTGGVPSFAALSLWIDESHLAGWDKVIVNVILGQVLIQVNKVLQGLKVPPITLNEHGVSIQMTPPVASIENGFVYVATSLVASGTPDLTGVTWPTDALFVLLSPGLIQSVVTQAITANLNGKNWSGTGSYKSVFDYSYSATINSISNITSNTTDMTQISGDLDASFSASASALGAHSPCAASAAGNTM